MTDSRDQKRDAKGLWLDIDALYELHALVIEELHKVTRGEGTKVPAGLLREARLFLNDNGFKASLRRSATGTLEATPPPTREELQHVPSWRLIDIKEFQRIPLQRLSLEKPRSVLATLVN